MQPFISSLTCHSFLDYHFSNYYYLNCCCFHCRNHYYVNCYCINYYYFNYYKLSEIEIIKLFHAYYNKHETHFITRFRDRFLVLIEFVFSRNGILSISYIFTPFAFFISPCLTTDVTQYLNFRGEGAKHNSLDIHEKTEETRECER